MSNLKFQYCKVKAERRDYLGERYYKYSLGSETCITVVVSTGNTYRRGKSNAVGTYMINVLTLFSNYLAMGFCEPITEAEFNRNFKKVVTMLNPKVKSK